MFRVVTDACTDVKKLEMFLRRCVKFVVQTLQVIIIYHLQTYREIFIHT